MKVEAEGEALVIVATVLDRYRDPYRTTVSYREGQMQQVQAWLKACGCDT